MNWKQIFDSVRKQLRPVFKLDWLHVFKDLIAVGLIVWTSLILINLTVGSIIMNSICDMGTQSRKQEYIRNTGSDANKMFTLFDDSQLLYIYDEAISEGITTTWDSLSNSRRHRATTDITANAEDTTRPGDADKTTPAAESSDSISRGILRLDLINSLVRDFGILIDGPYLTENGSWDLKLYKYNRDSTQTEKIIKQLQESKLPYHVDLQYPSIEVHFHSKAPLLGRAELTYQVSLWGEGHDAPLASSKPKPLFTRSSLFNYASIQPVQVLEEPAEAADSIVEIMKSMTDVKKRVSDTYWEAGVEEVAGSLDQYSVESLARLYSAVMKILISDAKSELIIDEQQTGNSVSIAMTHTLEKTLTTRLRFLRILNGVNFSGFINFAIYIFVIWGAASVLRAQKADLVAMTARANSLISLLPMLGFFGTLYGMLLAFSSVGVSEGGTKLVSMIGISLDTTLLAVSGAIILSLAVMWKKSP